MQQLVVVDELVVCVSCVRCPLSSCGELLRTVPFISPYLTDFPTDDFNRVYTDDARGRNSTNSCKR